MAFKAFWVMCTIPLYVIPAAAHGIGLVWNIMYEDILVSQRMNIYVLHV
jgi:hypothetical protein